MNLFSYKKILIYINDYLNKFVNYMYKTILFMKYHIKII